MLFYMIPQVSFLCEFHAALAVERFFLVVYRTVPDDLPFNGERFPADFAAERFDARVRCLVMRQPLFASEVFATVGAFVWLVVGVHAIVNVDRIQGAERFRAVFAGVRSLACVDPSMVVLGPFVGERAAANVADVLLPTFVNVSDVSSQVLLDAIRLSALVAFARSFIRVHAYVSQKASFREYCFAADVTLVRDSIVDQHLRAVHHLGLVRVLVIVRVGMSIDVFLQLRFLREASIAQIAREADLRGFKLRDIVFQRIRRRFVFSNDVRRILIAVVYQHMLVEIFVLTVVHQLAVLAVMHLGLVHGVHVIYEVFHVDEDDVALGALNVLYILGVRFVDFVFDGR